MKTDNPNKLFMFSLLAVLAACGPAEQRDEGEDGGSVIEITPLEDTNWQLVQITVAGGFLFTPDDPANYVLNFRSENRLTGTSDCNQLSGTWQQQESALRFEPFSATRSLCPPGSLHNTLTLNLRDVLAHEFRAGHMILTTPIEGVEMEFEPRN